MAFRISDYVVRGELINTKRYTTLGWLELAGGEMGLRLELTGDPGEDLKGRHIRFAAVPAPEPHSEEELRSLRLALMQIGPTGTMTAAGWCKTFACPPEEFYRRAKLGEAPPTNWKRRLYLSWFSQNGEVVVELAGPELEYLDGGTWRPLPPPGPSPAEIEAAQEAADLPPATPLDITIVSGEGESRHFQVHGEEDVPLIEIDPRADENDADDLQSQLDRQAEAIERAIRGESDPEDDPLAAAKRLDAMIDADDDIPVVDLFDTPHRFPNPHALSDAQVEGALKMMLGQLALCGVALHVCEHFTPRMAYTLLIERILREERIFRPMPGSGFVQGFMTSEYCDACAEQWSLEHAEDELDFEDGVDESDLDEDFELEGEGDDEPWKK